MGVELQDHGQGQGGGPLSGLSLDITFKPRSPNQSQTPSCFYCLKRGMKPRLALTEPHLVLKGVDDFQLNLF